MSDAKGVNVLAICGSLRQGSYNMAALRAAIELKPPGMTVEIADISAFPLYNEDVRAQGFPPPVEKLRQQIKAADALLFVTPGIQLFDLGCLEERNRLGVAAARPAFCR